MATSRPPVARKRSPLYPRKQTFPQPSLTSVVDPTATLSKTDRQITRPSGRIHSGYLHRVAAHMIPRYGSSPAASLRCAVNVSIDSQLPPPTQQMNKLRRSNKRKRNARNAIQDWGLDSEVSWIDSPLLFNGVSMGSDRLAEMDDIIGYLPEKVQLESLTR